MPDYSLVVRHSSQSHQRDVLGKGPWSQQRRQQQVLKF